MAMERRVILNGSQVARSDKKEEGGVGNRGHCLTRVACVNARRTIPAVLAQVTPITERTLGMEEALV
jgi:hypothetical protein